MVRIETYREPKVQFSMNPKKFMLWVFLVTITMLFAAFTSALIVAKADAIAKGEWVPITIPSAFTVSTILIILSSVTMQWAYFSAKQNEIDRIRLTLAITILLGIGFLFFQYKGYEQLISNNIHLVSTIKANGGEVPFLSSSFFYLISGIHALHVAGGVIFVLVTLISALRLQVHSKSMLKINLCATYWHFIGALWVYLFTLLNVIQ